MIFPIGHKFNPKSPVLTCSKEIEYAYTICRKNFLRVVPVDEILSELKNEGILSEAQEKWIQTSSELKENRNVKLFEILRNERSDEEFDKFCKILENNSVTIVKKLGNRLRRKAKEGLDKN